MEIPCRSGLHAPHFYVFASKSHYLANTLHITDSLICVQEGNLDSYRSLYWSLMDIQEVPLHVIYLFTKWGIHLNRSSITASVD